jgi:hypothetical protein
VQEDPLLGLQVHLWVCLKALVYAAPVDNEEALYHHTVGACQTIGNCSDIFERMRESTVRCVEARTGSHGGLLCPGLRTMRLT